MFDRWGVPAGVQGCDLACLQVVPELLAFLRAGALQHFWSCQTRSHITCASMWRQAHGQDDIGFLIGLWSASCLVLHPMVTQHCSIAFISSDIGRNTFLDHMHATEDQESAAGERVELESFAVWLECLTRGESYNFEHFGCSPQRVRQVPSE